MILASTEIKYLEVGTLLPSCSLSIFFFVGNLDRLSFDSFPDFLDVQFPIDNFH